jgi:hypothetical protein
MAPHLEFHTGAVRKVHSAFISEFPVGTLKFEVATKPWGKPTETGKWSLLVRRELYRRNDLNTRNQINLCRKHRRGQTETGWNGDMRMMMWKAFSIQRNPAEKTKGMIRDMEQISHENGRRRKKERKTLRSPFPYQSQDVGQLTSRVEVVSLDIKLLEYYLVFRSL